VWNDVHGLTPVRAATPLRWWSWTWRGMVGGAVERARTPAVEALLATSPRDVTTANGRVRSTLPDDRVRILGSGLAGARATGRQSRP